MAGQPQTEHDDYTSMRTELERIVQFEQMLLEQSSALYAARGEHFDTVIQDTLSLIGAHLGVDRAYVFRFDDLQKTMSNTHEWCAEHIASTQAMLQHLPQSAFPAWMAEIHANRVIEIEDVSALPPSWSTEREILSEQSIASVLVLPISAEDRLFGFMGFDSIRPGSTWNRESHTILQFFANNVAVGWLSEIKRQNLLLAMQLASEMARKAELASQEKSSFLSNMSHEIRTPMNAVIGVSHLMQNTDLTSMQRRYMDIIRTSSQTILNIINSILDLSKIESGKFELSEISFSLEEIIADLENLFQFQIAEKNLQARFAVDPRIPTFLSGDPTRLLQILTNLVSNAIKFSDEGCITVTCNFQDIRDQQYWLTFIIEDQGIGISADEIERLFDPFWQSSVATRQTHRGSGLGLPIARNLCDLMGGKITVESQLGVGSRFMVSIPFKVTQSGIATGPDLPLKASDRVLIIDDDLVNQRFLVKLFQAWSIPCAACSSVQTAMELLAGQQDQMGSFSICIVADQHTGSDDLLLIRQMRSSAPTIRHLLVLTGPDNPLLMQRDLWTGLVDGFLTKPIRASVLSDELSILMASVDQVTASNSIDCRPNCFCGVNMLVVEDIAINREIVRSLLHDLGIDADVANDGLMALDLVGHNDYDLILMDVQMPLMDGLEATRKIRQLSDARRAVVPILALTAHALREDRHACYEAGMNDHLIKPIDPDSLYQKLVKWIPIEKMCVAPGRVVANAPLTKPDAQANDFFDPQAGLALVGYNQDIYRTLLAHFAERYADLPAQIARLIAESNRTALIRLLHNLKSTAGHVGSQSLSARSGDLEKTIKQSQGPLDVPIQADIDRYCLDMLRLIQCARDYLAGLDQNPTQATSDKPEWTVKPGLAFDCNQHDLEQMIVKLKEHDPISSRQILNRLANAKWPEPESDKLQRVQRMLNQYQFESALELIIEIQKTVQGSLTGRGDS